MASCNARAAARAFRITRVAAFSRDATAKTGGNGRSHGRPADVALAAAQRHTMQNEIWQGRPLKMSLLTTSLKRPPLETLAAIADALKRPPWPGCRTMQAG